MPVANQAFAHIGASLVLLDRFRVSASLPVAFFRSGEPSVFNGERIDPAAKAGLGDLGLFGDILLLGSYRSSFGVALGGGALLPTGSKTDLLGDGLAGELHASAAGDVAPLAYAAKVSYAFRSGEIGGIRFNNELRGSAALGARLLEKRLLVGPEVFGAVDTGEPGAVARPGALELDLGGHYGIDASWRVHLGAGIGLVRSPGVPLLRVLAGVEWTPAPAAPAMPLDRDGDGIADADDACPDEACGGVIRVPPSHPCSGRPPIRAFGLPGGLPEWWNGGASTPIANSRLLSA